MKLMVVKDTHERIESILEEDNLAKIQEDYGIPMSVRLERSGPAERMTIGSTTYMALHEDALIAGLRFPIPSSVAELLRWYQVAPT